MFGNIFNRIIRIVEDWEPQEEYSNEDGYRNDLLKYLREELNLPSPFGSNEHHKIRKESGRALADIAVDEEVGIELKKDLARQAHVDRLVGQLRRYKKDYDNIIVVLVGETGEEAMDELRDAVNEPQSGPFVIQSKRIEIIDKGFEYEPENEDEDFERDAFGFPKFWI